MKKCKPKNNKRKKKTRKNTIPLDTFVGEPSNKITRKGLGMILTYV